MVHGDASLDKLVQLSRRMHDLAAVGDWDAVVGLEKERRDLIAACFSGDNPFQDIELAARRIAQILDLDGRLLEISAAQKTEVGAALNKLQQGRSAISAYEECTR